VLYIKSGLVKSCEEGKRLAVNQELCPEADFGFIGNESPG
jgi:hypothetical protein